jgi:hypothetical protein
MKNLIDFVGDERSTQQGKLHDVTDYSNVNDLWQGLGSFLLIITNFSVELSYIRANYSDLVTVSQVNRYA